MKKIFTGIIIIVSSFLFYDIYNKYQTTHEDNLYGIDSINNKFNNIVTFEQTNYENNKDFINDLSILADKYKVTVVKSVVKGYIRKLEVTYQKEKYITIIFIPMKIFMIYVILS